MKKRLKVITFLLSLMLSCNGCQQKAPIKSEDVDLVSATEMNKNTELHIDDKHQNEDIEEEEEDAKTDIPWINAYIDLLRGSDFEYDNYALVYVDGDDIPELVGCSPYEYQIGTYLENKVVLCYENMGRGTHSRRWFYLPKRSSIVSTCTGDGGIGTYEEFYTLENGDLKYEMSIGKIPQFDNQGNLLYDDAENYVWSYVKDEEEITKDMWKSMTMANEGYINFYEIEYCNKEEMLYKLQNYEE